MLSGDQVEIRCSFMRGGSSRGAVLFDQDLPLDPQARDAVILSIYGSPDPRQINGVGGGDPLTSKVAVVKRSDDRSCDVDYYFGQVSVNEPRVQWVGNCGNMAAAVAVFSVTAGLVPVGDEASVVRIRNTNTGQVIAARVPVRSGAVLSEGSCVIDGVLGSGAPISLDFLDVAGKVTGRLLPTGRTRDRVELPGGRRYEVSIVDAAIRSCSSPPRTSAAPVQRLPRTWRATAGS